MIFNDTNPETTRMNLRKTPASAVLAQAAQMDWLNDLPAQGLSAVHRLFPRVP
mgnify:CR=1 FL=1